LQRKCILILIVLCIVASVLHFLGVGYYSSPSAVSDLAAALANIHGTEYSDRETENGIESMTFTVEPKTWFLTNWNLRDALSLDYQYECQVIFTTHTKENTQILRTITYQAFDPMGADDLFTRAHLDLDSMTEETEVK